LYFDTFMSLFVILLIVLVKIIYGDTMKKINEIIKDFREDNDLSQNEVAKYLNIPRSTYGHYETGNSKIPIETVMQLSKLYNITPNDLLGFSSDLAGTDISKAHKLFNLIQKENININKLIEMIKLMKNIND